MIEIEVSYDDEEEYYDLRACPFCGGDRSELDDMLRDYYIECAACDARGPIKPSIQGAVDAWNKRVA